MCVFVCVCRDEEYFATHSKKELIETAKMIAKASTELVKQARQIANKCPDKRMRHVRPKNICKIFPPYFQLLRLYSFRDAHDGKREIVCLSLYDDVM